MNKVKMGGGGIKLMESHMQRGDTLNECMCVQEARKGHQKIGHKLLT